MSDEHERRLDALERRIDMLEALVLQQKAPPALTTLQAMEKIRQEEHQEQALRLQVMAQMKLRPPDRNWVPIFHSVQRPYDNWPKPCGQVGLYLTEPPVENQNARIEIMRVRPPGELEWRAPQPGIDMPVCSSCGQMIDPFSNQDLDYLAHMQPPQSRKSSPRSRGRRRSGEVSAPTGEISPGSSVDLPEAPPPTFAAHTSEARQAVTVDLDALAKIAREAGF